MDDEILAAVAAEQPAMVELLAELVEVPTLLGREAAGQAIMRRAFSELGLEPFDVPLDPAVLEGHPGAAPFSWDVDGKANVLATWQPMAPPTGVRWSSTATSTSSAPSRRRCGAASRSPPGATASGSTAEAPAT